MAGRRTSRIAVVLGVVTLAAGGRPPGECLPYLNMPEGDLDGMPLLVDSNVTW